MLSLRGVLRATHCIPPPHLAAPGGSCLRLLGCCVGFCEEGLRGFVKMRAC